jgi:dTDP-4-amino-4,6-dideoxygalactose transaminase
MNVPLADLHKQYLHIKPEIDTAIQNVIANSQFILGKAVVDFEQAFANAHQVKHCIAVGSGTDALHAALWALNIGQGDVVVTTPFTFIATLEAISLTGATPAFVDIDKKTFNIDVALLEQLLSKKNQNFKAIIPIHLYGQPSAIADIKSVATKFGVHVVEDACQSHIAKYDNIFVGNFGVAGCFSFYPGKNIGAFGEGGAIVTNDDSLALKLRRLRDHGQNEKYKHAFIGHNYRMDGIQGAVLGVKLKYLQTWTERRRTIASKYHKLLANVGDLVLPYELQGVYHVYHLYTIRTKQRNALQQFLATKQIATTIAYPIPLHFQEAYKHLGFSAGDFPESEHASEECLSLPIFAELSDEQVEYVCSNVRSFFGNT